MPTTQPRYTVTDSGAIRQMLDLAQRRWPEVQDRRQLLLRLASAGADRIARELDNRTAEERHRRQQQALRHAGEVIDTGLLLSDAAWR